MDRKLRRTVATAGLLTLSVSSFGGSAFAQTTAPNPVQVLVEHVMARYAHLKSWSATYSGKRSEGIPPFHVTKPRGSILFTAPGSIVVTPSGKGPIFGSCAEPGVLMFLCNFSRSPTLHIEEDSGALVLTGQVAANGRAPLTEIRLYVDRTTFDVVRVTTADNNGTSNEITFHHPARNVDH